MPAMKGLTLWALPEFPLVEPGDDVAALILQSMQRAALQFEDGDVLAVAQKVISKSENCYRYLNQVTASADAVALAQQVDKDPRLVELILSESTEVLRTRPGVIIVQHRNGYVHANAGIDKSNISCDEDNPRVLLLPENPDRSASRLRQAIYDATGVWVGVIINDSAGRAWRNGTVGMAIGSAGIEPVVDLVGQPDLFARALEVTTVAVADELAAAASFVMGQAAEGAPVVLVRGAQLPTADCGSGDLIREKSLDLFR